MATFTDKKNRQWKVELDVVLIEDVRDTFGVNLVNLDSDPLGKLRSNPVDLVLAMYLICEDQAKEQGIDQREFSRSMPQPPDAMIAAMEGAVVSFFPTGQASHVRGVLAKYQEMGDKAREMILAKISKAISDPKVMAAMEGKAEQVFDREMKKILESSDPGTPKSAGDESSTSSTDLTESTPATTTPA